MSSTRIQRPAPGGSIKTGAGPAKKVPENTRYAQQQQQQQQPQRRPLAHEASWPNAAAAAGAPSRFDSAPSSEWQSVASSPALSQLPSRSQTPLVDAVASGRSRLVSSYQSTFQHPYDSVSSSASASGGGSSSHVSAAPGPGHHLHSRTPSRVSSATPAPVPPGGAVQRPKSPPPGSLFLDAKTLHSYESAPVVNTDDDLFLDPLDSPSPSTDSSPVLYTPSSRHAGDRPPSSSGIRKILAPPASTSGPTRLPPATNKRLVSSYQTVYQDPAKQPSTPSTPAKLPEAYLLKKSLDSAVRSASPSSLPSEQRRLTSSHSSSPVRQSVKLVVSDRGMLREYEL